MNVIVNAPAKTVKVTPTGVRVVTVAIQGPPGTNGTSAPHTHVQLDITDLEPTVDLTVWFENQLT
jgi:hypothetical protein